MTSSSVRRANTDSVSTPASSPPPSAMETEVASHAMQKEEERMKAERVKNDAKRDAKLEKERQDDLQSGKDILDKKFQQLEFLMNKSKVSEGCASSRATVVESFGCVCIEQR